MMVTLHYLHVECSHCTEKKMYENVLSNVVKVTSALWVSVAISYVAIRIMENNDTCDDMYVNNYPWLN